MKLAYYVYMMASNNLNTVYTGVTNNLVRRVYEHKHGVLDGFSNWYHAHQLIYFETYSDIETAIARETQLKGWRRSKKNTLIARMNPNWEDLAADWGLES